MHSHGQLLGQRLHLAHAPSTIPHDNKRTTKQRPSHLLLKLLKHTTSAAEAAITHPPRLLLKLPPPTHPPRLLLRLPSAPSQS